MKTHRLRQALGLIAAAAAPCSLLLDDPAGLLICLAIILICIVLAFKLDHSERP